MGSLRSSMNKEEELTLFLEMRKQQRERNNHLLLHNSNDSDAPLAHAGSKSSHNHLPMFNNNASITHTRTVRKNATDEFLNSHNTRNDYDWLITPPETPLSATRETESQNTVKSRQVTKPQEKHATKSNLPAIKPASSKGLINTSITGSHRSISSVGSRPITPTRHPPLNKPSSSTSRQPSPTTSVGSRQITPTRHPPLSITTSSRSTQPLVPKPTLNTSTKPSRSATPKAAIPPRASTTPISNPSSRSLTPTKPQTVPSSRARTPTRGPLVTTTPKNPATGRSTSPIVKPRPLKPTDMPGFSLNVPPNLRTSLPDRLIPTNRGRSGVSSIRSSSVEPLTNNGKVRRQSCSPDRGNSSAAAIRYSASSVPALNRLHAKANDNVSPAMVGTKMVERLINMRKLAPPKQDVEKHSSTGKSSSESSGFGRTLSKKSLDMALRHMDIKRSIAGNLRPLMSNIPASSIYSVRSGSTRSKTISESPEKPL